jgi:hypothetical protein
MTLYYEGSGGRYEVACTMTWETLSNILCHMRWHVQYHSVGYREQGSGDF